MVRHISKLEIMKRWLQRRTDKEVTAIYKRCLIGDDCTAGGCIMYDESTLAYCNAVRDEFFNRGLEQDGKI